MTAQTLKVGDRVTSESAGAGVVEFGPVESVYGSTRVLVKVGSSGMYYWGSVELLSLVHTFSVGDTVYLSTRNGAHATVEYGPFDDTDVYVVKLVDAPDGDNNPRTFTTRGSVMMEVTADPYTYKGVTYKRCTSYTDTDGDTWEFGTVRGDGSVVANCAYSTVDTMTTVVDTFGPLTLAD